MGYIARSEERVGCPTYDMISQATAGWRLVTETCGIQSARSKWHHGKRSRKSKKGKGEGQNTRTYDVYNANKHFL